MRLSISLVAASAGLHTVLAVPFNRRDTAEVDHSDIQDIYHSPGNGLEIDVVENKYPILCVNGLDKYTGLRLGCEHQQQSKSTQHGTVHQASRSTSPLHPVVAPVANVLPPGGFMIAHAGEKDDLLDKDQAHPLSAVDVALTETGFTSHGHNHGLRIDEVNDVTHLPLDHVTRPASSISLKRLASRQPLHELVNSIIHPAHGTSSDETDIDLQLIPDNHHSARPSTGEDAEVELMPSGPRKSQNNDFELDVLEYGNNHHHHGADDMVLVVDKRQLGVKLNPNGQGVRAGVDKRQLSVVDGVAGGSDAAMPELVDLVLPQLGM